jgi:D-cysteine desulfhydrase
LHLILNGTKPDESSANTLLDELLGAEIEYVRTRGERDAALQAAVERLRRASQIPYPVPLGASTSLGALGSSVRSANFSSRHPRPT